jgi:hypothetical protein
MESDEETQCMFCLEAVDCLAKVRPCRCILYYHDACYLGWVEKYSTICPLCRKAPVPIVNSQTLELEFELIENPIHIVTEAPPAPQTADQYALIIRQNRILSGIWLSAGVLLIIFIIISLRTYNVI